MKILLDYAFPISVITPTPQASTAFLKQACVVCTPKSGQEGNVGTIYECANMAAVAARTDNTNAQQLFNAGMSKVYILLSDDLDMGTALGDGAGSDFYTLLISDDFDESDYNGASTSAVKAYVAVGDLTFTAKKGGVAGNSITITLVDDSTAGDESISIDGTDITIHMEDGVSTAQNIADKVNDSIATLALVSVAIAMGEEDTVQAAAVEAPLAHGAAAIAGTGLGLGSWEGVVGLSNDDEEVCAMQAAIENRVAFFTKSENGAKNLCYAFGKLLSNLSNWTNQQYITMPFDDDVALLGDANTLFDDKVSFVISDSEFGTRLALFAVGHKAIVAPYILKNLRIDLQSSALAWIAGNEPSYTVKEASLLENRLQQDVVQANYIDRNLISAGTVEITLVQDNFVANGAIDVAEPKALWRVFGEMRETL